MSEINKSLVSLQRKLDRMALKQLREHVLDLRAQLDRAEELLRQSDEAADAWRENFMSLQLASYDENFATHRQVGLTQSGELLVVKMEPQP